MNNLYKIILIILLQIQIILSYLQEDIYFPEFCMNIAENTDHVLIKYEAHISNTNHIIKNPTFQLTHLVLDTELNPIHKGIQGMCPNSTRLLKFIIEKENDLEPLFPSTSRFSEIGTEVNIHITTVRVTGAKDYQIFDAIKSRNASLAIDLIDAHIGINAFDENEQTPLMIASQIGGVQLIAILLNARMPKVNVNLAKESGYNALYYSIQHEQPTVLQALLRRGANPNTSLKTEDSTGNTPLHFACLLEKVKHALLLLEYGADPLAVNQHGQTPLELLPSDSVNNIKMKLARAFKESIDKRSRSIGYEF